MATASTRPCPPLTMSLTTAMSQTTQSIPDLSWVCSDIYIFPTSFHIFSVRYISSKYFRPEQFSAPGVCVWVLACSQNAVGPLVAPSPLSPGPAPVLSPGSHFSSQTSETSNSEQFTTNTLPSALKLLQKFSWSHRQFSRQAYILSVSGKTNGFSPGPSVCLWSVGNCISRSTAGCQHRMIEVVAADQSNMTRPKL